MLIKCESRITKASYIRLNIDKNDNNLFYAKNFKHSNNEFKKEIEKLSLYIKNNIKSKYVVQNVLSTINFFKKKLKLSRNINIDVLNIETYFDKNTNKL